MLVFCPCYAWISLLAFSFNDCCNHFLFLDCIFRLAFAFLALGFHFDGSVKEYHSSAFN